MSFDPTATGPSKSQRQADMMQHASHSAEYAQQRLNGRQDVARAFHDADCREKLWGKSPGCECPKCAEEQGYAPTPTTPPAA